MRRTRCVAAGAAALAVGSVLSVLGPAGPAQAGAPAPAAQPAAVPAAAPAAAAPAAPADGSAAIRLPRPTGPYLTGTTLLHLRDGLRIDPLDPLQRPRELMAQVWYPARAGSGRPLAPYAPPGEAAALQAFYPVPPGAFTATTSSRLQAPALPGAHKVVFFWHGLCAARTDTTVIDQELASRGFVVVALASTHEAPAVEFPGGRVETTSDPAFCRAGIDPFSAANQALLQRLLDVRVADTRFVLDEMTRLSAGGPDVDGAALPAGLAGTLDTGHVGIFGHSFGGGTAAAVMAVDRRFAAGVNLDGFVVGPVAQTGLDRPFLVMGSDYHDPATDPSWASLLPRLTGWHRWLRLDDAGHYRFIDLGGSVRAWGLDTTLKPADPETWRLVFGDIGDEVSQQIVTRVTTAFFERFLQGRQEPILNHAHAYYPELQDKTRSIGRP